MAAAGVQAQCREQIEAVGGEAMAAKNAAGG